MMHNYNTIIGVIGLRNNKVSYPTIRQRYGIGNSGIDLIMNRYKESGLSWEDFLKLEPSQAEELIYPPKNIRKDNIPMKEMPDLICGKTAVGWIYNSTHDNKHKFIIKLG